MEAPPLFDFAERATAKVEAADHQAFTDTVAHAVLRAATLAEVDAIREANSAALADLKLTHPGHAKCLSGVFARRRAALARKNGR